MHHMLPKDAVEIVSDRDPAFYSRRFLVERASNEWRLVIYVPPSHYLCGSDTVQDGDLQILIHTELRLYLQFVQNWTIFLFKAPCFGLSTPP